MEKVLLDLAALLEEAVLVEETLLAEEALEGEELIVLLLDLAALALLQALLAGEARRNFCSLNVGN